MLINSAKFADDLISEISQISEIPNKEVKYEPGLEIQLYVLINIFSLSNAINNS